MYVGRTWLKYSDDEVWQLTPRKFASQIAVHEDVTKRMYGAKPDNNGNGGAPTAGFIDQIPGW